MDLILIRHGIAAPHDSNDHARPLTAEGIKVTTEIARNLLGFLPAPDSILDSGLKRASETADLFHLNHLNAQRLINQSLVPGGDSAVLAKDLQKHGPDDVLFLVGHEPDMGRHASYFLNGTRLSFCAFKKAGVMWIEFEGHAAQGQGNLRCYLPPALSKHVRLKK